MLPPRLLLRRIPSLIRPLRPPRQSSSPPRTRLFTSNAQLLLISPPVGRPQLPFLHTPSGQSSSSTLLSSSSRLQSNPLITFRHGVPRLISTERRKKITDGLKVAFTAYALVILFYIMKLGLNQESIERQYPTPPEWSLRSRWYLRTARAKMDPMRWGRLFTDWVAVGCYFEDLIARMEDEAIDGAGIQQQDMTFVEGLGKVGFDIEAKSEEWRQGYFQILMGAGETAEKLDGWVSDTVLKVTSAPEYVVGPSNPNPKPMPPGNTNVIHEENCVPAYQSPEVFYMKILTTKGFKPSQKLDAALAYADWLDYKGLGDTAGDMYAWAMDIASAGLDVDPKTVIDKRTGTLKDHASEHVSENSLRASTAYGVHQVRRGDLASALPIFLSILRTRRNLPPAPPSPEQSDAEKEPSPLSSLTETLSSYIIPPPYPLSTRTGDEKPLRSPSSACEEAGLMVYIGEILFATSTHEAGLAWTRDAVDIAESTVMALNESIDFPIAHESGSMNHAAAQERCKDCLQAGLANWKTMVRKLVVKAEEEELEAMEKKKESWWGGERKVKEKEMRRKRWEAEEMILRERERRLRFFVGDMGFSDMGSSNVLFT